jgi:glutaredoxin 3
VPQIFIDGQAIGGYDDMNALERAGKLDDMLAGAGKASGGS